jgi:hypothetical protein
MIERNGELSVRRSDATIDPELLESVNTSACRTTVRPVDAQIGRPQTRRTRTMEQAVPGGPRP